MTSHNLTLKPDDREEVAGKTPDLHEILVCPDHHKQLRRDGDRLLCPSCGEIGRTSGRVVTLVRSSDPFYEGRYDNRTKYMPSSDTFLATLPLRIVLQGYPTSVAATVPAGSVVAELGCAGGVAWFGERYKMIGIDISSGALPNAAKNYVLAVQGDALRMPFQHASVDAVVSSCFFEHFDSAGKRQLLAECKRVLKPHGKLVFFYDIWTENSLISFYRSRDPILYKRAFLDGDGHIGYATGKENELLFFEAGFTITKQSYHERTPVLANSSWQKMALWPGALGSIAKVGKVLTQGPLRLPALAILAIADATVGKIVPRSHARCVTTIATVT